MTTEDFIARGAKAFNAWFNSTIATDPEAKIEILPELIAILYIRLRLWFEPEPARRIMDDIVFKIEALIENDELFYERDGVEIPFRPAESFENDDERRFYVEASWGLSEEDFDALLEE